MLDMKCDGISKCVMVAMLLGACCGPLLGADSFASPDLGLNQVVSWKGKNGKSIQARFLKEDGGVIHVSELNTGKVYQLKRETLAPETIEWYLGAQAAARDAADPFATPSAPKEAAPTGFAGLDATNLDRSKIPTLDQAKYGSKASDCVPNAYAMFFVWWDSNSNLKIPRGRDFDDKVEWIHKELARNFGTRNNSGTYYRDVDEGLVKFFSDRYEGTAKFSAKRNYDIRPASLAPLVSGANATVLCLSLFHGDDYDGGHAVSVLKLDQTGIIEFNTWGQKFTGKIVSLGPLKPNEHPARAEAPRERYEIKLDAPDTMPQWMKLKQLRFVIDPTRYDNLHVLTPLVKS